MTIYSGFYFKSTLINYPNWFETIQKVIFTDKELISDWCIGKISSTNIAEILSRHIDMPVEEILVYMEQGCKGLEFNSQVMRFASLQKLESRPTALVTVNMDVFTKVVIPAHNLPEMFDVIVNSADYGTEDKNDLWQIAFDKIGRGINYSNSLLIDDSSKWIDQFKFNGGYAYKYYDDNEFLKWLIESNLI